MRDKGMKNMTAYGNSTGYTPPNGSAGRAAFGEYSHKSNPLSVPRKGSSISSGHENADARKVQSMIREQASRENLRGKDGC